MVCMPPRYLFLKAGPQGEAQVAIAARLCLAPDVLDRGLLQQAHIATVDAHEAIPRGDAIDLWHILCDPIHVGAHVIEGPPQARHALLRIGAVQVEGHLIDHRFGAAVLLLRLYLSLRMVLMAAVIRIVIAAFLVDVTLLALLDIPEVLLVPRRLLDQLPILGEQLRGCLLQRGKGVPQLVPRSPTRSGTARLIHDRADFAATRRLVHLRRLRPLRLLEDLLATTSRRNLQACTPLASVAASLGRAPHLLLLADLGRVPQLLFLAVPHRPPTSLREDICRRLRLLRSIRVRFGAAWAARAPRAACWDAWAALAAPAARGSG
mmetsp:Transcript_115986/g.247923  ORF Transcript_115986/g.247923 Transcript_115986/m.247923 type:complete len:321 (-) Transcript_115986:573-1535(-)